jgi:hypothetical protein
MQTIKCVLTWSITLAIWAMGAVSLWKIWQFQKALPDPVGSYIEFTLMFIITFYLLMLIPIKYLANILCSSSEELSNPLLES